jgi:hypothetical protein
MTKKELKMHNELLNYHKFVIKCDLLRNLSPINLRTIQRLAYPHGKTQSMGVNSDSPTRISFRLKNSKRTISIAKLPDNYVKGVYFFEIGWTDCSYDKLVISAVSCKEIMHKINHVYKLTKPKKL